MLYNNCRKKWKRLEDPTWILPGLCPWVKVSQYLLPSSALSWNVNVKTKAEKYILPYNFGQKLNYFTWVSSDRNEKVGQLEGSREKSLKNLAWDSRRKKTSSRLIPKSSRKLFNLFPANVPFIYFVKTSENQKTFNGFSGYIEMKHWCEMC